MSDADKIKWNRKYEDRLNNSSLPQPNPLLKELTPLLHGQTALDLACGLGGNSVYLAEHGFCVTAWDISDIAICHLQDISIRHNLAIESEVKDLDAIHKVDSTFDLVIDTFYLNRSLFPLIKKAVKHGGLFLMQTFYQHDHTTNSHISDDYKLKPGELKDIFADWEILHFDEDRTTGIQSILAFNKQ